MVVAQTTRPVEKGWYQIAKGFGTLVDCQQLAVELEVKLDKVDRQAEIDRNPLSVALFVLREWMKIPDYQATRAVLHVHAALREIKRTDLAQSLYPADKDGPAAGASSVWKNVPVQTRKRPRKSFLAKRSNKQQQKKGMCWCMRGLANVCVCVCVCVCVKERRKIELTV